MALSNEIMSQFQQLAEALVNEANVDIEPSYTLYVENPELGRSEISMDALLKQYRHLIPISEGMSEDDEMDMPDKAFDVLLQYIDTDCIGERLFQELWDDFSDAWLSVSSVDTYRASDSWLAYQKALEEFEEKTRDWFEGERLPEIVEEQLEKMADEQGVSEADYHEFFRRNYWSIASEAMKEFEEETLPKEIDRFIDEYEL